MASAMASAKIPHGILGDQILANVVSSSWTNEGINYSRHGGIIRYHLIALLCCLLSRVKLNYYFFFAI